MMDRDKSCPSAAAATAATTATRYQQQQYPSTVRAGSMQGTVQAEKRQRMAQQEDGDTRGTRHR